MVKRKKLTNEELTKHFSNPFELVNHAITMAKNMVGSGHDIVETGDKNAAGVILGRVLKDRENEEKGEALIELDEKRVVSDDKEFPDPLQQAI